jgi:hypothetical protein
MSRFRNVDPGSRRGKPSRTGSILRTLYEFLHAGLWAIGAAFLLWLVINWHTISEAHSKAEALHAEAVANEDRAYCEKWGLRPGTHAHTICTLDLQKIRAEQARYLEDMGDIF